MLLIVNVFFLFRPVTAQTCTTSIISPTVSQYCAGTTYTFNSTWQGLYAWNWAVFPSNGVAISTPYSPATTIVFPSQGTYSISLLADCGWGGSPQCTAGLIVSTASCIINSLQPGNKVNPSLELFPNPCNGVLNIKIQSIEQFPVSVRLYDLTGNLIKEIALSASATTIDISSLANGSYYLEFLTSWWREYKRVLVAK